MYSTLLQTPTTLVIRGIIALIFGIVALTLPTTAFWALVIAFGAYAFVDGVSALIALVSAWALVTGALKIVLAIRLRRDIRGEWLLALSGVASIVLAILIMVAPLQATLGLIWALGIYAIAIGGLLIALSVRVRHWQQSLIEPFERAA